MRAGVAVRGVETHQRVLAEVAVEAGLVPGSERAVRPGDDLARAGVQVAVAERHDLRADPLLQALDRGRREGAERGVVGADLRGERQRALGFALRQRGADGGCHGASCSAARCAPYAKGRM